MKIEKSEGTTSTEKLLADLCEKSFLKLWSFPNPHKEDGDEMCDLLAVFENHVFIFFDRDNASLQKEGDIDVQWSRWKKKSIDRQIKTASGAEKYLLSKRKIYVNEKLNVELPINIENTEIIIHKIIVAHSADKACLAHSEDNLSGSLGIAYQKDLDDEGLNVPFIVPLDKSDPVHVFDSHTLPLILSELDTFFDLACYFEEKLRVIKQLDNFMYSGEEEVLAVYLQQFDKEKNQHFIFNKDDVNTSTLVIPDGGWLKFSSSDAYARKKEADKISNLWDDFIQYTSQNALDGKLKGANLWGVGKSAVHVMAKEPRFVRRELSKKLTKSIEDMPEVDGDNMVRHVTIMPSFFKGIGYVFLQINAPYHFIKKKDYLDGRVKLLELACGVAKNKFEHYDLLVGIAFDAPKYLEQNGEDLIYFDCSNWNREKSDFYDQLNQDSGLSFFMTKDLRKTSGQAYEFPPQQPLRVKKIGVNEPCPCGSGKKYKKCCRK